MFKPGWNPVGKDESLKDEMDPVYELNLVRALNHWPESHEIFQPIEIELCENDDRFVVHVSLPGLRSDDVHVSLSGNTLKVKGEYHADYEIGQSKLPFENIGCWRFVRFIELPSNADGTSLSSTFQGGVLEVSMQKKEE